MKGVILAGGKATRLYPLTLVTNKHLLPVYDKPVIYYAIEKLASVGVDKIMIVTSPHHLDNFVGLLGSGRSFTTSSGSRIELVYGIQDEPGGLAQGLKIAQEYIGDDSVIMHLGDNIFEDDIAEHVRSFKGGAVIFLKEVSDPRQFGVATIDANGRVTHVEEKPAEPRSNLAVTGLYIYDNSVFAKMAGQKPSARGEYEIGDLNNRYIEEGSLKSVVLKGAWFDVGTIDKLLDASVYMRDRAQKQPSKKQK